jgi:hypothetical protein
MEGLDLAPRGAGWQSEFAVLLWFRSFSVLLVLLGSIDRS